MGKLADFIEKNRVGVRQLKTTFSALQGAGTFLERSVTREMSRKIRSQLATRVVKAGERREHLVALIQ